MNNKGFTLIEVLIGLVILAVGLLGVGAMQVSAVKGNFFSRYLTQASYVGQDRLEFLDTLPINDPLLDAGNHNDGSVTIAGIVFNRGYTVIVDVTGDLKTIVYMVSWNDGANRNISFSTIKSIRTF